MERVRRDQAIKDQGAAGVCLCGTCGMEEEEKENRRTGTARGAATNGGFARCRGYGRRNDQRGGEWRTRHAVSGIKTNCRTKARNGSDGAGRRRRSMARGGVGTEAERVQDEARAIRAPRGSCLCGRAARRKTRTAGGFRGRSMPGTRRGRSGVSFRPIGFQIRQPQLAAAHPSTAPGS